MFNEELASGIIEGLNWTIEGENTKDTADTAHHRTYSHKPSTSSKSGSTPSHTSIPRRLVVSLIAAVRTRKDAERQIDNENRIQVREESAAAEFGS